MQRWWTPHIREKMPEWASYHERYWAAKAAWRKERGNPIPKKGQGKKATKGKAAPKKKAE